MLTETEFYQYVGGKVYEYRLAKNWTQQQLADALVMRRTSVTNIESGFQRPPMFVLYQIATMLGCSMGDLLPNSGQPTVISDDVMHMLSQFDNLDLNPHERVMLLARLRDGKR